MCSLIARSRRSTLSSSAWDAVLSKKLEIQVGILNRRRYAAIADGCGMTLRDTGHRIDGKELTRFLAAQFNVHIRILPLPRRAGQYMLYVILSIRMRIIKGSK